MKKLNFCALQFTVGLLMQCLLQCVYISQLNFAVGVFEVANRVEHI